MKSLFVFLLLFSSLSQASSYYDQFIYKGHCPKNRETEQFNTVVTDWKALPVMGMTKDGLEITPSIEIQLFDDGTFWSLFDEWMGAPGSSTRVGKARSILLPEEPKKITEGNWSVQGSALFVDGLGYGEPIIIRNKPAIKFTITNTTLSPLAINLVVNLIAVQSNQGPRHLCN